MKRIPCEEIYDLLPSYVENLTSEAENHLVEEHIAGCRDCRLLLNAMKKAKNQSYHFEDVEQRKPDFLKNNRRKNRSMFAGVFLLAVLLVAGVISLLKFVIGEPVASDALACEMQVEGNHLILEGTALDSGCGISDVEFREEDGMIHVTIKGVVASSVYDGSFREDFIAQETIRQVRIGERIIWDEGEEISLLASRVYETRHDYMGDMPANGRTAQALDLSGYVGSFLSELESAKQPYAWKIQIQEEIPAEQRSLRENEMESSAYILLAVIGNLDEVIYEYKVEEEAVTKIVTSEDATAFLGRNIKDCGSSVRLLDELIEKTGMEE